jgi:D-glycero-D-manno-heptose 1,7-bisphosphate phosphatase
MGTGKPGRHRAVFLDRDGVINRNVVNPATGECESPLAVDDFEFAPGAFDAMRELQVAGFLLFLVSNQPNYAKGKSSLEVLGSIHEKFLAGLAEEGIGFAAFYYCFHHSQGKVAGYSGPCECRKPSPHFLFRASDEFDVDLDRSWMVGDRSTDVECGKAAGTKTIFIHAGQTATEIAAQPDGTAPHLSAAVRLILNSE